jgi:hypothetical protein
VDSRTSDLTFKGWWDGAAHRELNKIVRRIKEQWEGSQGSWMCLCQEIVSKTATEKCGGDRRTRRAGGEVGTDVEEATAMTGNVINLNSNTIDTCKAGDDEVDHRCAC